MLFTLPKTTRRMKTRQRRATTVATTRAQKRHRVGPASYFDALPIEVVELVVQRVSLQPRHDDWASHISALDVAAVLGARGTLGAAASALFSTADIGENEENWDASSKLRLPDGPVAHTALRSLSALRHVRLTDVGPRTLRAVATHGATLKSLELRGAALNECALDSALRACGRYITDLRISGLRPYLTAVRRNWPHLRDLHLLDIDASVFANAAFWRSVGPSLHRLALSVRSAGSHNLRSIRKYCSALRAIEVRGKESLHRCVAKFVSSYGEQLESIALTHMENRYFAEIGLACVNARFDLEFEDDECLVHVLPIVGERLIKASVFVFFDMRAAKAPLIKASKTCVALKKLRVVGDMKASVVRALMQHAGTQLKELDIFGLLQTATKIIEAVAKGTGQLRRFHYHGYAQSKGAFGSLVCANPHLQHVMFRIAFTGYEQIESLSVAKDILVDLVDTFAKAPSLRSLIVPVVMGVRKKWFADVSDACQVFRFRNVHVELVEVDYFT